MSKKKSNESLLKSLGRTIKEQEKEILYSKATKQRELRELHTGYQREVDHLQREREHYRKQHYKWIEKNVLTKMEYSNYVGNPDFIVRDDLQIPRDWEEHFADTEIAMFDHLYKQKVHQMIETMPLDALKCVFQIEETEESKRGYSELREFKLKLLLHKIKE